MNNKEERLREMCEREREFCELLMFRSGWKWSRCGNRYLFSSHGIEWRNFLYQFFESFPRCFAFYILVLLDLPSQLKLALNKCSSISGFVCVQH